MSLDSFVRVTAIPECFERLQADAERMRSDLERLQRFVELSLASRIRPTMAANSSAPAPGPSAPEPVEMESSARQRLEEDAAETAKNMVAGFELMTRQGQSTATSLAYALRAAREASASFECPRTMDAILTALDVMDAAATEEQSNG